MQKRPPIEKLDQSDYIKTAVRLPRDLHADLSAEAERAGRSLNAEMVARMQGDPDQRAIIAELADIKSLLRKVLDAVT